VKFIFKDTNCNITENIHQLVMFCAWRC